MDDMVCTQAALGGHLLVLRWAVGVGCYFDVLTCGYAAIRNNHSDVVAWIELVTGAVF